MRTVEVKTETPYEIRLERGILDSAGSSILDITAGGRDHIVSDGTVFGLYGKRLQSSLEKSGIGYELSLIPEGERYKTMDTAAGLCRSFAASGLNRSGCVLALGGGVAGDVAGFAASVYMRGIPVVQIPTTLLSQVDSSVGGKTGVNLPQGKNLVGAFHQPSRVLIDPETLSTVSDRLFFEGMAEVIKYGAIADSSLFKNVAGLNRERLMENIDDTILRCCAIKAEIVAKDPLDRGERMLLNFGHTLGHALEETSGYGSYFHGEAVSAGMAAAARYGEAAGLTESGTAEKLESALRSIGLPVEIPQGLDLSVAVSRDKKQTAKGIRFILLRRIGEAFIRMMQPAELARLAGGN